MVTPRYLTAKQAATYLGLSRAALYMKIHRRQIPFIKRGRSLRFDIRQLDTMMQHGAQEALQ